MPNSNIDNFINIIGNGVRPNQFYVNINFPGVGDRLQNLLGNESDTLLCKSSSLPASTLASITVPFRGREIKLHGERTYATWSATFFNDQSFAMRNRFESWSNLINTHEDNTQFLQKIGQGGDLLSQNYAKDIYVGQLERNSSVNNQRVMKIYQLKHAFPTNIGPIELAYDSNTTIEEFSVDFEYSYFKTTNIEVDIVRLIGTTLQDNLENFGDVLSRLRSLDTVIGSSLI